MYMDLYSNNSDILKRRARLGKVILSDEKLDDARLNYPFIQ